MKQCKYRIFVLMFIGLCLLMFCVTGCVTADKHKAADLIDKSAHEKVPRISFKQLHHDFGKVKQGSTVEHVFTFKNTGTGVLQIKKIKSG